MLTRLALIGCVAAVTAAAPAPSVLGPAPIFRMSTGDFWLSLHQFLYVLGRAANHETDAARQAVADAPADEARGLAGVSPGARRAWAGAVATYASGPSRLDAVADATLVDVERALADTADDGSLAARAIDPAIRAALEAAAPVYRAAFWPRHRAANAAWTRAAEPLIGRYGPDVLARITKAYGMTWPADGYPVHIVPYSNWAGAFSTDGNVLIVSSLDAETRDAMMLETLFHEAMHQWDDRMFALLQAAARRAGKTRIPGGLSHALVFYTSGDAVRRVVPGYTPNAITLGIWQRSLGVFKPALDEVWLPYLDGRGTRDDALTELLLTARASAPSLRRPTRRPFTHRPAV